MTADPRGDQWWAAVRDEDPEVHARADAMAGAVLRGWPVPCPVPTCGDLLDDLAAVVVHVDQVH